MLSNHSRTNQPDSDQRKRKGNAQRKRKIRAQRRKGVATIWVILLVPVFLILLILVADIANLWLARVELENGLEASALAAVKEWGDAGGGSTLGPRNIGVEYAASNTIGGLPIAINTNHDPAAGPMNPNENLTCLVGKAPPSGNLIFGAITDDDPLTFNAGIQPGCGFGDVLFDATANDNLGAMSSFPESAWGIVFKKTGVTPPFLTIKSITYDLRAGGDPDAIFLGSFALSTFATPFRYTVADNPSPPATIPPGPNTVGLLPAQISVSFGPDPWLMTLDFSPLGPDIGFEPGDRIRFGAAVDKVHVPGNGQNDGDGVGRSDVAVTVVFAIGGVPQPPVTGVFIDSLFRSQSPILGDPDLIPASANGLNNDDQSYLLLSGAGGRDFAVRAQATVPVQSLFCNFCGFSFGPYSVTAKSTAIYECANRRPKLIRVDEYICPGP